MKCTGARSSSAAASIVCAFPLLRSSPTERSPTRGLPMPRRPRRTRSPMMRELYEPLGPAVDVRAGVEEHDRSVRGRQHRGDRRPRDASIVRSLISAIARNAPLFPAETTASACPSRTRSTAMTQTRRVAAPRSACGRRSLPWRCIRAHRRSEPDRIVVQGERSC